MKGVRGIQMENDTIALAEALARGGYFLFARDSGCVHNKGAFYLFYKGLWVAPEIIGFKWKDEKSVEVIAVEHLCKRLPVLPPSELILAYKRAFHTLYLLLEPSADTTQTSLGVRKKGSIKQGRYLKVQGKASGKLFKSQVEPFAFLALTFKDLFENARIRFEYFRIGGRTIRWICTYTDGVQYNGWVHAGSAYLSLHLGSKEAWVRLYNLLACSATKGERLINLLTSEKSRDFVINLHLETSEEGGGRRRTVLLHSPCREIHRSSLSQLLEVIRKGVEQDVSELHLDIYKRAWGPCMAVKRQQYYLLASTSLAQLSPLFDFICGLLSERFL